MQHLSEVMKILDAALHHDPNKAVNYATLLASKLEDEKQNRQARAVRSILAKSPSLTFESAGGKSAAPIDEDSQLATVDILAPGSPLDALVLHPYVEDKVQEFLKSVANYDSWHAHGVASANTLLIYGPSGTGKTTVARHIASRIGLPLVTTRSDTLVSSLLGQTSKNIRRVFSFAEANPCVLFLDEFDALAKNRNDSREIGELHRVVIALLQNIDAMAPSTVLIAATNHHGLLDPAVWRRFDTTIQVGLPARREREELWSRKMGDFQPGSRDLQKLVAMSHGMSGAQIETAARDISRACIVADIDQPSISLILRRLARVLWYDNYRVFDSDETEMAALRHWAPDVFSLRALADLFGVSTRQAANATRGTDNDAIRTDPAGPLSAN